MIDLNIQNNIDNKKLFNETNQTKYKHKLNTQVEAK